MSEELIIDEKNFSQYFRDCRTCRPERGDVIARWVGDAEFFDGQMKRDVIDLLCNRGKAVAATQVMRKLGLATQPESVRVCKEIVADLQSGMAVEEVAEKVYKYEVEAFYYTKKECIPIDSPAWSLIGIQNLDEFLDKANQRLKIKSKIVEPTTGAVNDEQVR